MTEREQAIADPRVGDKWRNQNNESVREFVHVDEWGVRYTATIRKDKREMEIPRDQLAARMDNYELIERGPKSERDPYTQPVAGDKWTNADVGVRKVDRIEGEQVVYERDGVRFLKHPVADWKDYQQAYGWRLIAKGDDPSWKPEPTQSEAEEARKEPRVGDEWRNADGNLLLVIAVRSWYVRVMKRLGNGEFQNDDHTNEDFAHFTKSWTLIRRGDAPAETPAPSPDDTGDEPPTPAFEGDPNEERFTTTHTGDKYIRTIYPRYADQSPIQVDVYNVLDAYAVPSGPLHHAGKKILCAGIRGHKDAEQDLIEARDAITRAIEMMRQKAAQ